MVDIFIKSFNRPYYLDRCLSSILSSVKGEYSIHILDDGTPEKYLDKIQKKYPFVKITKSENYLEKTKAIEENLSSGKEINGFQIPTNLWINAIKNASKYVIVIEDDVWVTRKIDVNFLCNISEKHQISLIKLGWLGNSKDDKWLNIKKIDDNIETTIPKKLFLSSERIMEYFFYNKCKFFSIGYRLGFFDNETKLKYWALNSILMGFWNKEYWLSIWKDAKGKVDEKQQLKNAAIYYKKHGLKNEYFIARLKNESLKTTFQSSATNSYHQYGFKFDVNVFNHLINMAWYEGAFDSMKNFPHDFSIEYFKKFLNNRIESTEFENWVNDFKEQYKNLGCNVD